MSGSVSPTGRFSSSLLHDFAQFLIRETEFPVDRLSDGTCFKQLLEGVRSIIARPKESLLQTFRSQPKFNNCLGSFRAERMTFCERVRYLPHGPLEQNARNDEESEHKKDKQYQPEKRVY